MSQVMTNRVLAQESQAFQGKGGISAETRPLGFRPAFLDSQTGAIYISRFADGRPAPFHLLDGLPDELVVARSCGGTVVAVKASVTAGFVRDGLFHTREAAAQIVSRLTLAA